MMCWSPRVIKQPGIGYRPQACGKCHICRQNKANEWIFRIEQQTKESFSAHFVTLTYHDQNIPVTKCYDEEGNELYLGTLNGDHLTEFTRELRRDLPIGLKYYIAGEYGGRTLRPHYHAIILNASEADIANKWKHGHCHFGTVEAKSITYTVKYTMKTHFDGKYKFSIDTRKKECARMSKGMGKNYINDKTVKWHKDDLLNRAYVTLSNGFKIPMPRYYKEKIYTQEEQILISASIQNKNLEKQYLMELDPNYWKIVNDRKLKEYHSLKKRIKNQKNN